MKKEDFVALGIDEAIALKCASAVDKELESYVLKTRFDEVSAENKTLKTSVKERDTQLESLKNSNDDVATLKQTIETLQAENKTSADNHKAEMHSLKVNQAVENALKTSGAINLKAVMPFLENLDKAKLLEDGSVDGLSSQIEKLTTGDDTKFLFGSSAMQVKGATIGQSGNDKAELPDGLENLDYDALCTALNNVG